MSKRRARRTVRRDIKIPLEQNCFDCANCQYIGEGDHVCDVGADMTLVVDEWTPTEDFYKCGGKDYVER